MRLPRCRAAPSEDDPWWRKRADWLYHSLQSGQLVDHEGGVERGRSPVRVDQLGTLELADGRLVLADPFMIEDRPEPISQRLGASPYEVSAALAGDEASHRCAAGLLVARHGDVMSWEMASWPGGEDIDSLGPEGFVGYGVDAGLGCFGSPEAAAVMGRVSREDAGALADPVSLAIFGEGSGDPMTHAVLMPPADGAPPLAVFVCGWGDGVYPTWIGRDVQGQIAVVLTDFLLATDPYASPVSSPSPPPPAEHQRWWQRWRRRL